MPTSMDRAVAAFQRWMRETAGPVPWAGLLGPDIWTEAASRHELLDRYNQHTKHRKHCSKALEVFTVAQRGAAGGFAAAALVGAVAIGAGQTGPSTWLTLLLQPVVSCCNMAAAVC
ncbi:TPA: hypothetical protein ACH3X1_005398 [Trebouxia sp. C0004]